MNIKTFFFFVAIIVPPFILAIRGSLQKALSVLSTFPEIVKVFMMLCPPPHVLIFHCHHLWFIFSEDTQADKSPTHGFTHRNVFPGSSWCEYIFPGCICWQRRGAAKHAAWRVPILHRDSNVHPPLNSLQVPHRLMSNRRILLSGAGSGPTDG